MARLPKPGPESKQLHRETETTRGRTTNERDQFTILFPDGSGKYRVDGAPSTPAPWEKLPPRIKNPPAGLSGAGGQGGPAGGARRVP